MRKRETFKTLKNNIEFFFSSFPRKQKSQQVNEKKNIYIHTMDI